MTMVGSTYIGEIPGADVPETVCSKNAAQDGNNNIPAQDLVGEDRVGSDRANVGSEQWKSGGDCGACRREKYCGTPCRASKIRRQIEASGMVQRMLEEMMKAKSVNAPGEMTVEDGDVGGDVAAKLGMAAWNINGASEGGEDGGDWAEEDDET